MTNPAAGRYALIIACSDYQDPRLRQLPKTEADAAGMHAVLIDPRLCGFPEVNVSLQVNAPGNSVKVAIEKFFKHRERDDLLVLYFAGHGIIDEHRRLTLALNETDPDYRATGIEARFLREEMENCRSDRQVLILDCCNAGAFAGGRDAKGAPAGLKESLKGKGRFVLAASDKLQFSFDQVVGRESIANGIFTHYLIEGLHDYKAVSANGRTITATSLYNYAHEEVARATEQRQTPVLILPDEKRIGDIALAQKPAPVLPAALHAALAHVDYAQRLGGVYQLREAVRSGEDYAEVAREVLHKMAEEPQHRLVHRAIDEVLAELASPIAPATRPEPKTDETPPRGAASKPAARPAVTPKPWMIVLVLVVLVAIGIGFYMAPQGDQAVSREVMDERSPVVEKTPEAIPSKDEATERQTQEVLRDQQIERLLSDAADKQRTLNLTIPRSGEERAALDDYRAVLALDPDNEAARIGVRHIAEYFAGKAEEAIGEQQWDRAEELLDKASESDAELPALAVLRKRISEARLAKAAALSGVEQDYKAGRVFYDPLKSGGKGPAMVVIPAGEFLMGSPSSEPERGDNEGPQHRVRIANALAIGQYEVTFAQYDAFAEATGRDKPADQGWGRGRRPVINVSWEDATAYAQWLSEQTGAHYRLPSEAEWEYAARAGTTTPFHFGERISTDQANFNGNYTYNGSSKGEYRRKTVEVGGFLANAFGLHDMHGNVWEWVQDCWHDSYKGAPEDGSAWESEACAYRSLRGGSWSYLPQWLRSADRDRYGPTDRVDDIGFRLARTL